jgi:hypothetical protein
MSAIENPFSSFNNPEKNFDIKRKNILRRLMSSPLLQRTVLTLLLTVFPSSDVQKDEADYKQGNDKIEVLDKTRISEDSVNQRFNNNIKYEESLGEEDYKKATENNNPMYKGETQTGRK